MGGCEVPMDETGQRVGCSEVKWGDLLWKCSLFEDFVVFGGIFGADLLVGNRVLLERVDGGLSFWFWFWVLVWLERKIRIKGIKAPWKLY